MSERLTHTCCVCGLLWQSMDQKREREVLLATRVNKSGPYCDLCQVLTMAQRYATHRGVDLRAFVELWFAP